MHGPYGQWLCCGDAVVSVAHNVDTHWMLGTQRCISACHAGFAVHDWALSAPPITFTLMSTQAGRSSGSSESGGASCLICRRYTDAESACSTPAGQQHTLLGIKCRQNCPVHVHPRRSTSTSAPGQDGLKLRGGTQHTKPVVVPDTICITPEWLNITPDCQHEI
jgi:hypothetical protein